MKKILLKFKQLNYRHYICAAITICFLLCALLLFNFSYQRLFGTSKSLVYSIGYYLCEAFGLPFKVKPAVIELFAVKPPYVIFERFPETWEEFKNMLDILFKLLANKENLEGYFGGISRGLNSFFILFSLLLPFIVPFVIWIRHSFSKENNNYNKNSKPLKIFKAITKITYIPAKKWIIELITFIKENSFYWKLWLVVWLLNFNVVSICIEAVAFLLYFSISFDVANIYTQFRKLIIDISPLVQYYFVLIIPALFILNYLRKEIGYSRLEKGEEKNVKFLSEQPIALMFCGTMGSKKTTIITDLALSQQKILREKALELLIENDMKFPEFSWITFENELKKQMTDGVIFNLYSAREYVKNLRAVFESNPSEENCFGYEYLKYGLIYNNELSEAQLFDVLENYAQEYLIYVTQSSLILSNYSIRTDDEFKDKGNFPLWDMNYFRRKCKDSKSYSRFAHILDFDTMRLGKTLVENNKQRDAFEFGIIMLTEIGKERGNKITNEGVKRVTVEANQKNDKLVEFIKLVRHPAIVEFFPFVRIITDDQRPESLGAESRELCNIVHIQKTVGTSILMPFYFIEEFIFNLLFKVFKKTYLDYRNNRGDNILIMHVFKKITAFFYNRFKKNFNTFASTKMQLKCENGLMESLGKEHYYLSHKKIYSDRFSTDCFSEYFHEKVARAKVGLAGIPVYGSIKATFSELNLQNSYFINDLNEYLLELKKISEAERIEQELAELETQSLIQSVKHIENCGKYEEIPKDLKEKIKFNKDVVKLAKELLDVKTTHKRLEEIEAEEMKDTS